MRSVGQLALAQSRATSSRLPSMPTDMAFKRVGPVSPILLFVEEAVVHMMAQGHVVDVTYLDCDKAFDTRD